MAVAYGALPLSDRLEQAPQGSVIAIPETSTSDSRSPMTVEGRRVTFKTLLATSLAVVVVVAVVSAAVTGHADSPVATSVGHAPTTLTYSAVGDGQCRDQSGRSFYNFTCPSVSSVQQCQDYCSGMAGCSAITFDNDVQYCSFYLKGNVRAEQDIPLQFRQKCYFADSEPSPEGNPDDPRWSSSSSSSSSGQNCFQQCDVNDISTVGRWIPIASSNAESQVVTYTTGLQYSKNVSNTQVWIHDVFKNFGFNLFVVSYTSQDADMQTLEQSFATFQGFSKHQSVSATFKGGVVWQYQLKVASSCGGATFLTPATHWTPNAVDPPCCLPGLFDDSQNGDSPCLKAQGADSTVNVCSSPVSDCSPATMMANAQGSWQALSAANALSQEISTATTDQNSHLTSRSTPVPPPPAPPLCGFFGCWNTQTIDLQYRLMSVEKGDMQSQTELVANTFVSGVVWQYQVSTSDDSCPDSFGGHNLFVTTDATAPCCKPGYLHSDGSCAKGFLTEACVPPSTPTPDPTPSPENSCSDNDNAAWENYESNCRELVEKYACDKSLWSMCCASCENQNSNRRNIGVATAGQRMLMQFNDEEQNNDEGQDLGNSGPVGRWVLLASSNSVNQTIVTVIGDERASSTSTSGSTTASADISGSFGVSWDAGANSVGGKLFDLPSSATTKWVGNYLQNSRQAIAQQPVRYTFPQGYVWQWQFSLGPAFNNAVVRGHDLRVTNSASEPPCCLPGLELKVSEPRGECRTIGSDRNYNLCKEASQKLQTQDSSTPPTPAHASATYDQSSACAQHGWEGRWVPITNAAAHQQAIQYTHGLTAGQDSSSDDSTTVGATVHAGISHGFSLGGGATGTLSLGVSAGLSATILNSMKSSFEVTANDTYSAIFGKGAVWQWQFSMPGNTKCQRTVFSPHLRVTSSLTAPPCCLPGYEKDGVSSPHGPCVTIQDPSYCPGGSTCDYNLCTMPKKANPLLPVAPQSSCTFSSKRGSWQPISSSNSPQRVTFKHGTGSGDTTFTRNSWGDSISLTLSASFNVGLSVSVGVSAANQVTNSLKSALQTVTSLTSTQLYPAGVVWQWQFDVESSCGNSTIYTGATILTTAAYKPPCCLPGFFSDDLDPHSTCEDAGGERTPNLCDATNIPTQTPYAATSAAPPSSEPTQQQKQCSQILRKQAAWVPIASSSHAQSVMYAFGTEQTGDVIIGSTSSTEVGVSIGYSFGLGTASVGVAAHLSTSSAVARSNADAFATTSRSDYQMDFMDGGVVWQFQFTVDTGCGTVVTKGKDLRITDSLQEPPCCLPGYERDIAKPHGSCSAAGGDIVYSTCPAFPGTPKKDWPCDTATDPPPHGRSDPCPASLPSGSTCRPTCDAGYTVSGTTSCSAGVLSAASCLPKPCDASAAPTNGVAGECTSSLASGATCQPSCDAGYTVSGVTSCSAGVLSAATCVPISTPTPTPTQGGCQATCSVFNEWGGSTSNTCDYWVQQGYSCSTLESENSCDCTGCSCGGDNANGGNSGFNGQSGDNANGGNSGFNGQSGDNDNGGNSGFNGQSGDNDNGGDGGGLGDLTQAGYGRRSLPQAAPRRSLSQAGPSWTVLGQGFCANDQGNQPDFIACNGVASMQACERLCDHATGLCQGINYAFSDYVGYTWRKNQPIQAQQCFLYIAPNSAPDTIKSFVSQQQGCSRGSSDFPADAISQLQIPPAGMKAPTYCALRAGEAAPAGSWKPIGSSNSGMQKIQSHSTSEMCQSVGHSGSSKSSESFGISVSAYGVTLGLDGKFGQGNSLQKDNGVTTTNEQGFSDMMPSGVVWQWVATAPGAFSSTSQRPVHFRLTPSILKPPCCHPGQDPKITEPWNRGCLDGIDLCDEKVEPSKLQAMGEVVESWRKVGDGQCEASDGSQPQNLGCPDIESLAECQALCDGADFCEAVEYTPLKVQPATDASSGCMTTDPDGTTTGCNTFAPCHSYRHAYCGDTTFGSGTCMCAGVNRCLILGANPDYPDKIACGTPKPGSEASFILTGKTNCRLFVKPDYQGVLPTTYATCSAGQGVETVAAAAIVAAPTPPYTGEPQATTCYTQSDCTEFITKEARWVPIATAVGDGVTSQQVKFLTGRSDETGSGSQFSTGHSTSFNFALAFKAGGFGIGLNLGGSHAQKVVGVDMDAFYSTGTKTNTQEFKAGVVWQFQYHARGPCGDTTVFGSHLRVTKDAKSPPCCLPGFEKNITQPTGSCNGPTEQSNLCAE